MSSINKAMPSTYGGASTAENVQGKLLSEMEMAPPIADQVHILMNWWASINTN